jgi:hypothetical protein
MTPRAVPDSPSPSAGDPLDDLDPSLRGGALQREVRKGGRPARTGAVNLHCHTFYSFNAFGYSPTHVAVIARRGGWAVAGIVDFDVLDGLTEFLAACRVLDVKGIVSIETRVFVGELKGETINSPGEPGVAYHMGVGFTSAGESAFLTALRQTSRQRIVEILRRVNEYFDPVQASLRDDVLPLTPSGNVTERHLCVALEEKAKRVFPAERARAAFWRERLGSYVPEGTGLRDLIRARSMKHGTVGYVAPTPSAFPSMTEMNEFVLRAGGIPTIAWLDGTSDGESDVQRLLAVGMSAGAAAVNIIPDRNYSPGVDDLKLRKLRELVEAAGDHGLPIVVGTEMNAPGNRLIDDFDAPELQPLVPAFRRGASIVYGHTLLQPSGHGYLSTWAAEAFASTEEKNRFFEQVGGGVAPPTSELTAGLPDDVTPKEILAMVAAARK